MCTAQCAICSIKRHHVLKQAPSGCVPHSWHTPTHTTPSTTTTTTTTTTRAPHHTTPRGLHSNSAQQSKARAHPPLPPVAPARDASGSGGIRRHVWAEQVPACATRRAARTRGMHTHTCVQYNAISDACIVLCTCTCVGACLRVTACVRPGRRRGMPGVAFSRAVSYQLPTAQRRRMVHMNTHMVCT